MVARGTLLICVVLAGVVGTSALARADGVDDSVSRVRTLLRANDAEGAKLWIAALADIEDERVGALLRDLFGHDDDGVAILACRTLAKRADKRFLLTLNRRVTDRNFAEARPVRFQASLAALREYASPTSMDPLEEVVERNFDTAPRISVLAIESYARIQEREVVDHLVRWLARAEALIAQSPGSSSPGGGPKRSRSPSTGASGGPGGPSDPSDADRDGQPRARLADLGRVLQEQLQRITAQNHPDAAAWLGWWKKHRAAFRF